MYLVYQADPHPYFIDGLEIPTYTLWGDHNEIHEAKDQISRLATLTPDKNAKEQGFFIVLDTTRI